MVTSAVFFSGMAVLVKLASATIPTMEIVLVRGAVSLGLSYAGLRRLGVAPFGVRPGPLLLRGLLGFGGLCFFYFALSRLSLADATVIHFTNPVFTAILAGCLLGEALRRRHVLGILVSLVGVALVAQPDWWPASAAADRVGPDLLGIGGGLLGSLASAGAYTTIRWIGRREHPLVVVFYFPLVAVPAALPFVIPVWVWPDSREWGLLLGIGLTTQVAQVFMTRGLQSLPAGRATGITYLQIVFAAGWGLVIFGEPLTPLGITGAVLVVAGTMAMTTRGRRPGPPATPRDG